MTWSYFRPRSFVNSSGGTAPTVSVIRPLWGLEEPDLENHRSLLEQTYPSDYEVLFCAERAEDPALLVVTKLLREFPHVKARTVSSHGVDGLGVMKSVIAGVSAARHDIIVFTDSDVRLPRQFLRSSVPSLADPHVGLAFCVPMVEGAEDWAAAMFSSAVNDTAAAVTPLARLGLYGEAIGTTMLVRRNVIAEIGGLERFARSVTHDVPLARAISGRGYRVLLLREPAIVTHCRDRFSRCYKHLLRWMVIIRSYHPAAIFLAFPLDLPLYWALAYLAILAAGGREANHGLLLVALALTTRSLSTTLIEGTLARRRPRWKYFWARCLLELVRLPLFVQGLMARTIEWRDRRMRIGGRGQIEALWDRVWRSDGELVRPLHHERHRLWTYD